MKCQKLQPQHVQFVSGNCIVDIQPFNDSSGCICFVHILTDRFPNKILAQKIGADGNLRRVSKVDKKVADESGQLSKVASDGEFTKKRRSVPFSSHLAINSLAYLITSPLSKFTAFSNSGFPFLFGKQNL